MSDVPDTSADPADQLDALGARLTAANPDLYRHLALYLQVLREVLPGRVEQASFHLATRVFPQRYTLLPFEPRLHLHRRRHGLVHRALSLLTVEQLAVLAAQIDREEQRLRRRRPPGRRPGPIPPGGGFALPADHEASGPTGAADAAAGGSVNLDLQRPPSAGLLGWQPTAGPAAAGTAWGQAPEGASHQGPAAGEPGPGSGWSPAPAAEPAAIPAEPAYGEEDLEALLPSPWLRGELPRDPLTLLRWLDGFEAALVRRLRNLSHAINVEMLRVGLSNGLLPVSLLDAVLTGQLETLSAPPNLLRLQLPFPPPGGQGPFEATALLLRPADLELEEPRLRTCRRRWQQHRQELRRMARQFRLLQRRHMAAEAERLWLQDVRTNPGSRP